MDAAMLRYLGSPAGAELMARAALAEGPLHARVMVLRATHTAEQAAAALTLADLRRRAARKFAGAPRMLFTPEGLEQSTGSQAAGWRAERFPEGALVHDLCCGIGGDTMALASRGDVVAVDLDPGCAVCARANSARDAVGEVAVACADVLRLRLAGGYITIDPGRRVAGRRVRDAGDYLPSLEASAEMAAAAGGAAIKVSPAIGDDWIERTGARCEFVSVDGECRECVLWFGEVGPAMVRSAVLLPEREVVAADGETPPPATATVGAWIHEPDPAVIRAHAVARVAAELGAGAVAPGVAYLAGDSPSMRPYATSYRVLAVLSFGIKQVKDACQSLGVRPVAVKRRGLPFEPADVEPRLRLASGRPAVVILYPSAGRPMAAIVEPPSGRRGQLSLAMPDV